MMQAIRCLSLCLVAALWTPAVRADESVDLILVLAADVSRSVDAAKFQLQRDGYARAFSDPRVLRAITSGLYGRIAVSFVEWSGPASQKLVIDWTVIKDSEAAQGFGGRLIEAPRSFADSTSISAGIDFAMSQFGRAPYQSGRCPIDVSGDGDDNSGRDVRRARDEAVAEGVTVNGLVILTDPALSSRHTNPPGGLANYYRENVIGGPGAFVMVAEDFNSFGRAITNKLIAEIAQTTIEGQPTRGSLRAHATERPLRRPRRVRPRRHSAEAQRRSRTTSGGRRRTPP
jgi:Protein of unknown function (DUF1194)